MKNNHLLLIAALLVMLIGCNKKSSPPPPVPIPVTPVNPYYFKGTFNGATFNFTDTIPQYAPFYTYEVGGFQEVSFATLPDIGLSFDWPFADTVKEGDLLGLIGKTLYFNDSIVHPELTFDSSTSRNQWFSVDTANTDYYVRITSVTYLKKDVTLGYKLKTYVITGTCNAVMTDFTRNVLLSNASFSFIVSREDY